MDLHSCLFTRARTCPYLCTACPYLHTAYQAPSSPAPGVPTLARCFRYHGNRCVYVCMHLRFPLQTAVCRSVTDLRHAGYLHFRVRVCVCVNMPEQGCCTPGVGQPKQQALERILMPTRSSAHTYAGRGSHHALALCASFSLTDVGSAFPTYVVFLFFCMHMHMHMHACKQTTQAMHAHVLTHTHTHVEHSHAPPSRQRAQRGKQRRQRYRPL